MSIGTPVIDDQPNTAASSPVRSRDSTNTRQLLLHAARRRFARNGYAATTVREIAADAGVNVALINRYFTSKEGLFEACLARAAEDLGGAEAATTTLDQILATMIEQFGTSPDGEQSLQLLLLLRSSGDESADRIRRNTLESFAERMAVATGLSPTEARSDALVLRAQMVLATGLGMVLLRSSSGMEPLTSATSAELEAPLSDLLSTLLGRSAP
jgi:AcrR family transcriptional regulator